MTQTKETAAKAMEKPGDGPLPHAFNFVELQARSIAAFAEANTILMQTAKAILENESRLFQAQSQQARDAVIPFQPGSTPDSMIADLFEQYHQNSERAISHLRSISDTMRDCEWRLLGLVAHKLTGKAAE